MILNQIMGARIKRIRQSQNLTQAQLGKMLEVTQSTINKWESGDQEPSWKKMYLLSQIFNTSLDYLYTNDDDTKTYLNSLKTKEYLLNENSPLNKEDKDWVKELLAEKEKWISEFEKTKDIKYFHYKEIVESNLNFVILNYQKHQNEILKIEENKNNNKIIDTQQIINTEINLLNEEQKYTVLAYIDQMKSIESRKEKIIKTFNKTGE